MERGSFKEKRILKVGMSYRHQSILKISSWCCGPTAAQLANKISANIRLHLVLDELIWLNRQLNSQSLKTFIVYGIN